MATSGTNRDQPAAAAFLREHLGQRSDDPTASGGEWVYGPPSATFYILTFTGSRLTSIEFRLSQ